MATPQVMAPVDRKPPVGRKDMHKPFAASLTGTALEFYDFAVTSRPAVAISHAPGHVFLTAVPESNYREPAGGAW